MKIAELLLEVAGDIIMLPEGFYMEKKEIKIPATSSGGGAWTVKRLMDEKKYAVVSVMDNITGDSTWNITFYGLMSDDEGKMSSSNRDNRVYVSREQSTNRLKLKWWTTNRLIQAGLILSRKNLDEERPTWKDSDAPDANGKFRDLGINDLADWLIKTRKGDMQRITGSLNQQIVFNRKKDPAYAKKMESVRSAVKRKLKKD
jgi:hypothetical protein